MEKQQKGFEFPSILALTSHHQMAGEHRDVKLLLAQFEASCSLVSKQKPRQASRELPKNRSA